MPRRSVVQVLLLTLFINTNYCAEKKYSNYTLYRGIPLNDVQLQFFQNLTDFYYVNFWRGPGEVLHIPVEFIVDPDYKTEFLKHAEQNGVYLTTIMEDVQSAFDLQTVKSYMRRNTESFNWQDFYRLKDIYDWMSDLAEINPRVMTVESIGKSYLGNDILSARIVFNDSVTRSRVIVEGGIHAREWIGSAFVTYMIDQILHAPKSSSITLKKIAESYEWYFVPVLNPDGYEYTHTKDRLWRKNGRGVDLNRNFGIAFGTVGVSRKPRDDTFCGKKAFSEPESTAMANFVTSKSENLRYYLAFHSYGQYMILPYTHSRKHQANYEEVKKMGDKAAAEIFRRYKTRYTVGTAFDTVGYMTSGVSGCWAKSSFNIPYVVTFELRDKGTHGFALPTDQILPTCRETMDGIMSLMSPHSKINLNKMSENRAQKKTFLGVFVLVWNFLMFMIVRF